jgi:F0F1-type ATP synthase membrane subunit c/vacuolar-type H+-ATPase subunit K
MRDKDLVNLEEAYSQVVEEGMLKKIGAGLAIGATMAGAQASDSKDADVQPNYKVNAPAATSFTKSPQALADEAYKKLRDNPALIKDEKTISAIAADPETSKEFMRTSLLVGREIPNVLKQKYPQFTTLPKQIGG